MPLTIGVFSASSPVSAFAPERYLRGKEYLQHKGFRRSSIRHSIPSAKS